MIRHITDNSKLSNETHCWTYCGRLVRRERCIDLETVCIEDAECKGCQRSDDRRQLQEHVKNSRSIIREMRKERMKVHAKAVAEAINKELLPEGVTVSFEFDPDRADAEDRKSWEDLKRKL